MQARNGFTLAGCKQQYMTSIRWCAWGLTAAFLFSAVGACDKKTPVPTKEEAAKTPVPPPPAKESTHKAPPPPPIK